MNKTRLALLFLAMSFAASSAYAQVINFDDLPSFTRISNGYAGLNWSNFYAIKGTEFNLVGIPFRNGVVSPNNVAFWSGSSVTISSGTAFNLVSGYFTALSWSGETFTATANTGATLTPAIKGSGPTLVSFNWNNVNSVTLTTNGVVGWWGGQFALDNLSVTAVPEPEEYGMMLLGFGMVGYQIKRKQKMAALTAA